MFGGRPQVFTPNVQPFLHSEAELSRVTDRLVIGNNRLHLMHSMQPKTRFFHAYKESDKPKSTEIQTQTQLS